MVETNDEISNKLKISIHDYYMGYIKQKLKYMLANGKENEISDQIIQFLDAQIDTGNSIIIKDDIVRILNSVILEEDFIPFDLESKQNNISHCFPNVSEITIENGEAAYLVEKFQTPFSGIEEKSYYLYVSPKFYDENIRGIEDKIKRLEKDFSRQDFKSFEQKFNQDLASKQYELESAKVFESASKQIELKCQKFNQVSQKMINEYGKKYEDIITRNISNEEKSTLICKLLEDTKSYDERNRQSVLRLNSEYEKLSQNFQGKVESSNMIYSQMQNLHLFDKARYFEDMMASVNPELRDLYKKRYLLNSYRISHNELVYKTKPNVFMSFIEGFLSNIRYGKTPLMLGPHFERDYPNRRFGNC